MLSGKYLRLRAVMILAFAGVCSACFAVAWTPADTNCWGWWDPSDDANMLTNDAHGRVSSLLDLSSNGRHMTQTTLGRQPYTGTRTIGLMNAIDLVSAETNHVLMNGWSDLGTNGHFTVFAVHERDGGSDPIINWQDRGYFRISSLDMRPSKSESNGTLVYSGGPYTNQHIFNANMHWDPSTNLPLSYFNAFVDGYQVGTNHNYALQFDMTYGLRMTFLTANNNAICSDGAMGEVVIIETVDDELRLKLEGYLAHKWGLVDSLPIDHIYRKRPPGVAPPGTIVIIK